MFRKSPLPISTLGLILAAVLLICAMLIPMGDTVKLILCILSFLAAFFPLALPIWTELKGEKRPGYPLLLAVACLIFLFAGRPVAGAAAMVLYRLAVPALEWQRERVARVISRRRELAYLGTEIGEPVKDQEPADDLGRFLRRWLPYISLALAAAAVILLMLLSRMNTALVLRRAAMLLALGNALPLFWSYGLCDCAASVNACEHGAVFSGNAMAKAQTAKLCCIELPDSLRRGNASIQSVMPEEVPPLAMLELAACAWSCSPSHLGDTLAELLGHRTDPELLDSYQELRDFGVLAHIGGRAMICGSAEFMQRAGLPLTPFKDRDTAVHVGFKSQYAGCIRLDQTEPEESELDARIRDSGLYRFGDKQEAAEKRDPGEPLLYASALGDRGPAGEEGIFAALGGYGEKPDISTEPGGCAGAILLLDSLLNAKRSRKLTFLPVLGIKALLLILALLGLCPIWLPVLAEAVSALAGTLLAKQALNTKL